MCMWLKSYEEHKVAYDRVVFPLVWLLSIYTAFFIYAYIIQWITETFT